MTSDELEILRQDIDALRRAVRKANPFLRSIMALRVYALMSVPLGALILAFCLISHFFVRSYGSFQDIPSAWKTALWIALVLIVVGSAVLKWIVVNRRAAAIEKGANFLTATKAIYGSSWANVNLPATICIFVLSAFAIYVGRAWYIVSINAIFLGLIGHSMGRAFERKELSVIGWYALASGLASLFFIESSPFIWAAIVWAGIFFAYGAAGLYYLPREEKVG